MKQTFVVAQSQTLTRRLIDWGVPIVGQVPEMRFFIPLANQCRAQVILIDWSVLESTHPFEQVLGQLALLAPDAEIIVISESRSGIRPVRNGSSGPPDLVFSLPEEADRLKARLQADRPGRAKREEREEREIPAETGAPLSPAKDLNEVPVPQIISFYSPKGGVGKTWLAVNVGTLLARLSGQPTVLFDVDLFSADVGAHLDLLGGPTLVDLIPEISGAGPEGLSRFLREHKTSGLRVLVGPDRPELADLINRESLIRILELLACRNRFIVLDHSSDPGSELLYEFLERSHRIFMVTTLETATLRQVRLSLQTLRRLNIAVEDRVTVVANMVGQRSTLTLDEAAEFLEFPISILLPDDRRAVEESIFSAKPLALGAAGAFGQPMAEIAARVLPGYRPENGQPGGLGALLKNFVWRLYG